jgi:hypothetical protein
MATRKQPARKTTTSKRRRRADEGDTSPFPSWSSVVFYLGLGGLVVAEIVEWPVVVAIAVGHVLTENRHKAVRELGEALEDA